MLIDKPTYIDLQTAMYNGAVEVNIAYAFDGGHSLTIAGIEIDNFNTYTDACKFVIDMVNEF